MQFKATFIVDPYMHEFMNSPSHLPSHCIITSSHCCDQVCQCDSNNLLRAHFIVGPHNLRTLKSPAPICTSLITGWGVLLVSRSNSGEIPTHHRIPLWNVVLQNSCVWFSKQMCINLLPDKLLSFKTSSAVPPYGNIQTWCTWANTVVVDEWT
jgi:hypothetical protein